MNKSRYTIYLGLELAKSAVHGVFSVRNGQKQPMGEHGCKSFDLTGDEAVTKLRQGTYLGRAFGDGEGTIGIDCDDWMPDHSWTNGTGYREISASGRGVHFICRVPVDLIPPGNKIVKNGDHKIEIFYGRNVGIALAGTEASAGDIDLDLQSEAGKIIRDLFAGKCDTALERITSDTTKWAVLSNKTIPPGASEAFQSVVTRIALDLGKEEGLFNETGLLTPQNIKGIFEHTEIYQCYYQGQEKYADHKILPTIEKAFFAGLRARDEARQLAGYFQTPVTQPVKKDKKATATKHQEGFCISPEGVPEFWCPDYDHPLRYHLAHIADYFYKTAERPRTAVAWITAVVLGAALCGRQYTAFGGRSYSRMYVILSAPSASGKGDVIRGLKNLVMDCQSQTPQIQNILADIGDWTSDAAVHASIALTPQSVAVWDECGHKIKHMATDSIAMSVLTKLTEAFSAADGILYPKRYADSKKDEAKAIPILHPGMSVIGLGTPEQLSAITEDMIADGRFSRFFFVNVEGNAVWQNELWDDDEADISTIHLNPETAEVIHTILKTATMRPETTNELSAGLVKIKQEITKRLKFDKEHSPKTLREIDYEYQQRLEKTVSKADRASLGRALEVAKSMSISRTLLGTAEAEKATKITYETLMECLREVDASITAMHELWAQAEAFTQREERIAKEMAEIFADKVKEPYFRVYWSPDISDALKRRGITIGGKNNERPNIDAILLADYHIAVGKEGNMVTGRKYYYDTTSEHAQAFQTEVDFKLRHPSGLDANRQS